MSFTLTEEQQLIQQTAGEFAQEFVGPVAADIDKTGAHPADLIQRMAEYDFLGLYLPAEYGGAEAGYLSYILTIEQLAKVSGAVASILVTHASQAAYAINRFGTDAQKRSFLAPLAKGENLGAFAISEPGAAPGIGPDRLVAVKDGDSYVLNGKKAYVANGGAADTYVVFALTDPDSGAKGLSAFIVDGKSQGLSVSRIAEKMGLNGWQTADLDFKDVKVPAANLLGQEGAGVKIAGETKAIASIAQGAVIVGIAQAAMEDAAQYSKQRIQFGRPIANFPAIQNMLADMAVNIYLARLAVYDAANLVEQGERFEYEAAMVSYFSSRLGQNALIDVIQVEGGYGYSQDMLVSRLFRDVKGVITMDSSVDFPEKVIAGEILA